MWARGMGELTVQADSLFPPKVGEFFFLFSSVHEGILFFDGFVKWFLPIEFLH
jgi:hypothetical protein